MDTFKNQKTHEFSLHDSKQIIIYQTCAAEILGGQVINAGNVDILLRKPERISQGHTINAVIRS